VPDVKKWRLLDTGADAPAWNMAVDEVLFLHSQNPALRTYGWNPPAVSLGYFQNFSAFESEKIKKLGVEIVRRATGGGAILHEDELTYSMAADMGDMPFAETNTDAYRVFHEIIIAALAGFGISASERGGMKLESDGGPAEYCFAKSASMDVVADGRKIAGSAQRRRGNRILMHGSIFLGPNRLVPEAASVSSLAGRRIGYEEFAVAFVSRARKNLGVEMISDMLTETEKKIAVEIASGKYSSGEWTRKK